MKRFILIITAAVLCVMLAACGESRRKDLEKSRYAEAKNADFVTVSDEQQLWSECGKMYPIGSDEVTFYVKCDTSKQYYYGEGEKNALEIKKDGEWYALPYKQDHWKADAFVLGRGTTSAVTFRLSDFDYEFEAGEYRYVLPITAEGETDEPLVVYSFKMYDSYPFGDISADDVESCIARDMWTYEKLNDEQTQKLLEIVRKIKLKNDGKIRRNDYLGGGEYFEIQQKSGDKIHINLMPNKDEIIISGFVYQAVDNKTDELKELYDSVQENSALEKSRYAEAKNADFVTITDERQLFTESGKMYPIGFDEVTFYVKCDTSKQYYCGEGEKNALEIKKDGEWYALPYKQNHWKASAFVLGRGTTSAVTFRLSDFDYEFEAGEYRYVLPITAEGETDEPLVVYSFKMYDSYPYEYLSADDVKVCFAEDPWNFKILTDEQTEKLLEIVRKIKLKNDSKIRSNDYVGDGESFGIWLKNSERIYVTWLPKDDEFIIKGFVYEAVDSKADELEEFFKTIKIKET